jgi:hypothetical protein
MYYGDQDELRLEETRLIPNSTSVYSLKAKIKYYDSPNQESLLLLFNMLFSSPNIKELDLSITKLKRRPMQSRGQPNEFDFHSNPDARFPPLEVLRLKGCNLDSTSNADWVGAFEGGGRWKDVFNDMQTTDSCGKPIQQVWHKWSRSFPRLCYN